MDSDRFFKLLLGDNFKAAAIDELRSLFQETRQQLQDPLLGFELLLPDEDTSLDERISSASQWASGFLYGWLKSDQHGKRKLSEDADEFIADCESLASNEYSTEDEETDGEAIYVDLVEYLRMGALLIQEEAQPIKAAPLIH